MATKRDESNLDDIASAIADEIERFQFFEGRRDGFVDQMMNVPPPEGVTYSRQYAHGYTLGRSLAAGHKRN